MTIYVQRQKHTYATPWSLDDSTLTKRKLDDFKKEKLAEAAKDEGLSKFQRNVTVSALFKSYIEHLRRNENQKGEYVTSERRNSDRVESQIDLHLSPFFGKMLPKDVAENLIPYRNVREREKASPSTINGEFRLLSAALRRGWKDNRVRQDQLPKEYPMNHDGEKGSARTGTYTDDQLQCLMTKATPQFRPLFATLVFSGLRPKEARWVKRENVVLSGDAPLISVTNHKTKWKTGKGKSVAIIDELLPMLQEWERETAAHYPDCEFFFHVNGKQFTADLLETEWDRVRKACKIPTKGVMLYDARRTHSVLLDTHDVSKDDRKAQMGHVTDAMSDRYNTESVAHVRRIRTAFSKKAGNETTTAVQAVPEAPKPQESAFDAKAELMELKSLFEAGLLPEDMYKIEIAAVMRKRSEMR